MRQTSKPHNLVLCLVTLAVAAVPAGAVQPEGTTSDVTCAAGSVEQGIADAVNGDCILIEENACMEWAYAFEVPDDDHWGYGYLAYFRWKAGWDIPIIVDNVASALPEPRPVVGNGLINILVLVDEPARKTISDGGTLCFSLDLGFWETTATAAGYYYEYVCDDWGTCVYTTDIPYNRVDMPGSAISTG